LYSPEMKFTLLFVVAFAFPNPLRQRRGIHMG
jgi:hypothetical protein